MPNLDYEPLTLPFQWRQGEHMAVVGDTGTGKSTLMARLLPSRSDYIVVRTKPDDVKWDGKLVRKDADISDPRQSRWILQPRYNEQYREIRAAFDRVLHKDKGWALCIDELYYVDELLHMRSQMNEAMTQGRSRPVTMMMGMQRPVIVTRFALSQATHVLVFQQDDRDAVTIGTIAGGRPIAQRVARLGRHEFLWYYRPERTVWVGRFNPRSGTLEGTTENANALARER